MELENLRRAVNVNKLEIKLISYTRLQPNLELGYSEAEVNFSYFNAEEVFKMGVCFSKEPGSWLMGKITRIDFP